MTSYQQYAQLGKKSNNSSTAAGNSSCKQSTVLSSSSCPVPLVRADMQKRPGNMSAKLLYRVDLLACLLACLIDGQLRTTGHGPLVHNPKLKVQNMCITVGMSRCEWSPTEGNLARFLGPQVLMFIATKLFTSGA
ncbi:hypothetical protein FSHL1_001097 [Fusarium sambucinum]